MEKQTVLLNLESLGQDVLEHLWNKSTKGVTEFSVNLNPPWVSLNEYRKIKIILI